MSHPPQSFPLKVNSVAGEEWCCLQVQLDQLIADVKSLLEEQLQVPIRFQSLTQNDVTLADSCTVGQCGLETGATVLLVKESVAEDGLVQALRRDIESLLPRDALDSDNPEVPRRGPLTEFQFNADTVITKPGDMNQDENGFLMSKCSQSLLASYFLKSGADPNCVLPEVSLSQLVYGLSQIDKEPDVGGTALHYAARLGLPDVCRLILRDKRFSKINLKNHFGRTALHLAALETDDEFSDGRNSMRAEVCRLLVQDERCDVNLAQGFEKDDDQYETFDDLFGDYDRKAALHVAGSCDVIVEALLSSSRVDCNIPHPGSERFFPLNGCINFNCCGGSRYMNSLKTCLLLAKRPDINLDMKAPYGVTVPEQLLSYTDGHGGIEEELLAIEVVFEFVKNKNYDAAKCHLTEPLCESGQVPLICRAAVWGSPKLLSYLLKDEGIDPNEKSRNMSQSHHYGTTPFPASGQTLLHYACEGNSLSLWAAQNVRAVLQCGRYTESVNVQDELGRTPFHVATRRALPSQWYQDNFLGYDEESPLGILWNDERVDVNLRDVHGETALHVAIGLTESVEEFVEKENLFEALAEANSLCGVFLRSKRFNVTEDEIKSFLVQRVLFKAIEDGGDSEKGPEIIEKFWVHPGVTSLNGGKNNPLVNAAEQGNVEMCKRLLADPRFTAVNGANGDGDSALIAVAFPEDTYEDDFSWESRFQIIRILLEDPRTDLACRLVSRNGSSPLSQFLDNLSTHEPQWLDLARAFLKDPRTDANYISHDGETPLHRVCSCTSAEVSIDEQTELCKFILQNSSFKGINAKRSDNGNTALIVAAAHDDATMGLNAVKALLEDKRTDCTLQDNNAMTALGYAEYLNRKEGGTARKEMHDLLAARMES